MDHVDVLVIQMRNLTVTHVEVLVNLLPEVATVLNDVALECVGLIHKKCEFLIQVNLLQVV